VKNSKVTIDGSISAADESIPEYFEQAAFGDLTEPTTIMDMHGRVMVWALPGVLHPNRLVRSCTCLLDVLLIFLGGL
jgi:hypothetical protein